MRSLFRSSILLTAGAIAGLFALSGCESINTSENTEAIASMKTFHIGDVHGALSNFGSRNQRDVVVLTQEMVARQLLSLGYREAAPSDPADMTVVPGWSFYKERSKSLGNNEPINYEPSLYNSGNSMMARLGLEVLGENGQVLWSSMSSRGMQASVGTTMDISYQAQQALIGFPEAAHAVPPATGFIPIDQESSLPDEAVMGPDDE